MKIKISQTNYWLSVVALGLLVGFGIREAKAWFNPTAPAPGGNVYGPLTTSGNTQTKPGEIILSAGGAWNTGGLTIGNHSLNSNTNGWLYVGDQNHNVYGGRGLAADYLYANVSMYADSLYDKSDASYRLDPNGLSVLKEIHLYGRINFIANDWALATYGNGWNSNSQPQNPIASIYTNDIFLRSIGKWASQLGSVNESDPTVPANIKDGIDWSEITGKPAPAAATIGQNSCYVLDRNEDQWKICPSGYYLAGMKCYKGGQSWCQWDDLYCCRP